MTLFQWYILVGGLFTAFFIMKNNEAVSHPFISTLLFFVLWPIFLFLFIKGIFNG